MSKAKIEKVLPEEVAEELTQVERILAHVDNGYALLEEDIEYFEEINQAFRIIFNVETPGKARKKLMAFFGKKKNLTQLVNDTTLIYGDFFEVNKNALRIIQEKRHQEVYRQATAAGEFHTATLALQAIDKLYGLYTSDDKVPSSARRLPKVRRSSNPAVFEKMNRRLNE